jgi:asparagine synthase (glutamine-hydrolysing)
LSGIFGAVSRNDCPLDRAILDILHAETAHWGRASRILSCGGVAALGAAHGGTTPESALEIAPLTGPDGCRFTAAGRVDNRNDLAEALGLGASEAGLLGDTALLHHAWLRWGDSCPERIYGDWALASWDPERRRLFLARDHTGTTALYYYVSPHFFAFSSSRRALLRLPVVSASVLLDELYLAQILVSWSGYHGDRTIHTAIRRLPPAHSLTLTPQSFDVKRFWRPEDTRELALPRADYIPAFREVFDRSVQSHLRSEAPIAATLSGGLDSSSVVATAAALLRPPGRRLSAFTSVPCFPTDVYTGRQFGDELPFARITTGSLDNIDLAGVAAEGICPIGAIRRAMRISLEPKHGACNMYWLMELRRVAVDQGCRIMLTGARGNEGISWTGNIFSQPLTTQLRVLGGKHWLRQSLRRNIPGRSGRTFRRYRTAKQWQATAVNPDLVGRLDLIARYLDEQDERNAESHLIQRTYGRYLGATHQGASQAEMGAAAGIEMRDPTGDPRILAFCYSVPERIFRDPVTGSDRWLIREAMQGRLPDAVRLNRRRGRQAADLVPRLRNSAAAVETALAEIERGPASAFVSVAALRRAWKRVRIEDTPDAFLLSVSVLTRGIMAGLFVNGFGTQW